MQMPLKVPQTVAAYLAAEGTKDAAKLALCIGIVAGLRAVTAPAVVSWAARLGWLNLHGSILAFMGTSVAVVVFSLGAIGEYVNDKLPKTASRTAASAVYR